MSLVRKLKTAAKILLNDGYSGVRAGLNRSRRVSSFQRQYVEWVKRYGEIDDDAERSIRRHIDEMPRQPLISVILPVYNIDEIWLRKCIESVRGQIFENWQLCIADDHSPSPHVREVLNEYAKLDPRINVTFRDRNGHISAASNTALEMAKGEFCVLLDHDDELSPDALFYVADEIVRHAAVAMIYSDEDMIDEQGQRYAATFKPDFSRDLLYSLNMVTHLSAYRTDVLREIGGFREGTEGSQDFDLALRVLERIDESQIRHIPRMLYHWRAIPGSVAYSGDEKPYAHERGRQAIRDHLQRTGVEAEVVEGPFQLHHVRYRLPQPKPSVAVIVHGPGADIERFGDDAIDGLSITPIPVEDATMAHLNDAALKSECDVVLFLESSLETPTDSTLEELAATALQPSIGVVGGKVLDRGSKVAAGAFVIGGDFLFSVAHLGYDADDPGLLKRNMVISNFSAVSISCMAIKRSDLEKVGGFDVHLSRGLADIDLCLRLWKMGLRVVYDPFCTARVALGRRLQTHPTPIPSSAEMELFRSRWASEIAGDRFYNRNLDPSEGQFRIRR